MNIIWSDQAWTEYLYWQETDKKIVKRINTLIKDIQRSPFIGIGSPEALKHNWTGFWSRRIDKELRFIYKTSDEAMMIAQCRYHY